MKETTEDFLERKWMEAERKLADERYKRQMLELKVIELGLPLKDKR